MFKLYIVKGVFNPEGELKRVDNSPHKCYYTISLNLNTIEGCIERKGPTNWRVSIQNGEKRKYHFPTFQKCVEKTQELFYPVAVELVEVKDISLAKVSNQ